MDIQTRTLAEGITLYILPDEKFKNCVQGIYFNMPLKKETATGYALLPKLLTAGNAVYKDKTALHMEAESLYGVRFSAGTEKNGEVQVLSFAADAIADRYAGEALFTKVQTLLDTVIRCPRIIDDGFDKEVFVREKEALREDIRSIVNDKRRFALVRCCEEMCKDEAYGIRADGREEDLDLLTPQNVYALYQEMLSSARIDIVMTGAFDTEIAVEGAMRFAEALGGRKTDYPKTVRKLPHGIQNVEDKEDVQQGKLVMGFRTDVDPTTDDYYALMVYNGIFGGGTASKLFNNVREKMSLCYYASSALDKAKGLMFVQSGIEFSKFDVAREAILAQHKEILEGNISEAEFEGTVQGLINQLRTCKDSPALLLGSYRRQLPLGTLCDIDTVIEKILAVKREQIPAVARLIHLDTVYFLNGKGGETK